VGRVFLPKLVNAVRAAVRPSATRNASTHHIKSNLCSFQFNKKDLLPAARRPAVAEEGPGGLGCRVEKIGARRCFLRPIKVGGG
jgi:hypothetical protein